MLVTISKKKQIFIVNKLKFNHSKKYILFEVEENPISKNNKIEIIKFINIPNKIMKVEPLRPIILPNMSIIIAVINGRNIIIKYNYII